MKIIIREKNTMKTVNEDNNMTIMDLFKKHTIIIDAPCNGKGTCGNCKVKVENATEKMTQYESQLLSKAEIDSGIRLACRTIINDKMEIEIDNKEMNMIAYTKYKNKVGSYLDEDLAIAVDIGTTTIAMALVDTKDETIIDTLTYINPQSIYGADILSRIEIMQNKESKDRKKLANSLRQSLKENIKRLLDRNQVNIIKHIVISGNTAMTLFFLEEDVTTLGVYPFKTNLEKRECLMIDRQLLGFSVYVIKPISGFVGGDSVSGIYYLDLHKSEKRQLVVDIGTNSEVLAGNSKGIKCTATAAGPVFEGGHLTDGISSVSGAIYSARYFGGNFYYNTIDEEKPRGICGTGVIDIVSECLTYGIIDSSGAFVDETQEKIDIAVGDKGNTIGLTQKDLREIQLAKAAIATAQDCIIKLVDEPIDTLYFAGGMGNNINIESAKKIGLISNTIESKIKFEGNISLGGAIKIACDINLAKEALDDIQKKSQSIILSELESFEKAYIAHLDY